MAHTLNRLNAPAAKPGKHSDGGGLRLHVRPDGGSQWVLRGTVHGRRREMGLGSASEVSLKEARESAEGARALVRAEKDPIKERIRERKEAARNLHLFKDIAKDAFESREAELKGDVWTIPGEAMKGRKDETADFRVPLSQEAMAVLKAARQHARDGYMFPSVRKGVISDATMSRLMERTKLDARPHGFRSSLRDWIAETTETPHDVAETCLDHTVGGSVERAYRRTDLLEQRRVLMERWAKHVTGQNGEMLHLVRAVNGQT